MILVFNEHEIMVNFLGLVAIYFLKLQTRIHTLHFERDSDEIFDKSMKSKCKAPKLEILPQWWVIPASLSYGYALVNFMDQVFCQWSDKHVEEREKVHVICLPLKNDHCRIFYDNSSKRWTEWFLVIFLAIIL